MVFDRFFIVNEGLNAVLGPLSFTKGLKEGEQEVRFQWMEGRHVSSPKSVLSPFPGLYPDYDLKLVRLAVFDRTRHF